MGKLLRMLPLVVRRSGTFFKRNLTAILAFCVTITILFSVLNFLDKKRKTDFQIRLHVGVEWTKDLVKYGLDTLRLNGFHVDNGADDPLLDADMVIGKADYKPIKTKVDRSFIVVVVISALENLAQRDMIRSTWGIQAKKHGVVVTFFLCASSQDVSFKENSRLLSEYHKFGDILVDDFQESKYTLAIKTLRALKYFKLHHAKSTFLVKTEDDVFVNVPNLIQYCIEARKQLIGGSVGDYFIGGVINSESKPQFWNPYSRWYTTADIWHRVYQGALDARRSQSQTPNPRYPDPSDKLVHEGIYPPFVFKGFYILSYSLVEDILQVFSKVPPYHLEDVYVTGVLAHWVLKANHTQVPGVSLSTALMDFSLELNYVWYKLFVSPSHVLAYKCSNVNFMPVIYKDTVALYEKASA